MKYITFTVPCYNSAAYMHKCIDSLLTIGRDAEIIIVDDGSSDNTGIIADGYAEKYPNIVRVIHKENGGHGSGVNAGLEAAKGLYFKVVDSDDWLNEKSLKKLLNTIKLHYAAGMNADLYFSNYVYEHVEDNTSYSVDYKNVFPQKKFFTWKDTGSFRPSQYITMHAMLYKTEILRKSGLKLPLHTFYVDNIFIFHPLPYVETMFYLNTDLYRYFIGRSDQSVNQEIIIKRIDQQIFVTKWVAEDYLKLQPMIKSRKLKKYMLSHISILVTICSVFLTLKGTPDALIKKRQLWDYFKHLDKKLYNKIVYSSVAGLTNIPGKGGRFLVKNGYKITRKIFKYN